MKIVYCIPHLLERAGMERVLSWKANYLAACGHEVVIVTTEHQQDAPTAFPLDERIRLRHLQLHYEAHYRAPLLRKYAAHRRLQRRYRQELTRLLRQEHADLCISLCGKEVDFLHRLRADCRLMAEIHFALDFREQYIRTQHQGRLWQWLGRLRTRQLVSAVKRLDRLVVLTEADRRQWAARGCRNVVCIHNFNPLVQPPRSTCEAHRAIAVGRLQPQKGYDLLIRSWEEVHRQCPDWTLDIYGQGPLHDSLQAQIDQAGLHDCIRLMGGTDDIAARYSEASLLVLSSRFEGFGMVIVEAMSCGLPAVAFDCPQGPGEIITHGQDGLLAEPEHVGQLTAATVSLMQDDETRKRMGRQALLKAAQFDHDRIMQQWTTLFNSLTQEPCR